jgi:hypothetical protein
VETEIALTSFEKEAPAIDVDLTFGTPQNVGDKIRIPIVELSHGVGITLLQCLRGEHREQRVKRRPLAYLEVARGEGPSGGTCIKPVMDSRIVLLASVVLVMWVGLWVSLAWRQLSQGHRGGSAVDSA